MRIVSGMQPSGRLHLGNYLGALTNWQTLQHEHDCVFFVADWHALSTNYEAADQIKANVRDLLTDWLAAGIDPERATIFIQSHVPAHAVLHLLLSMITPIPWLERNPTYKEQRDQIAARDLATHGFLGYPVLQAADILLYRADGVPVGKDQLPHLELTRELARRFNSLYAPVLVEPAALLTDVPKVLGTDGRKMSKSYGNAIYLSDTEHDIRHKIKTMVTDPARVRRHDPGNPDVCPVFTFHHTYSDAAVVTQIDQDCRTAKIGCIDCKHLVANGIVTQLAPLRDARATLAAHPTRIDDVTHAGQARATTLATHHLEAIKDAMHI